ncbi:MAG TPA: TonB-dependent receptor, partial [Vicinamibacterales bacterium]
KSLINQTYEGPSFVGNNSDPAIEARGGTAQPNLLFWETHGDLGGPILKDRLWFFVSRNHFHINEAISGVPQTVATNLGIVDDFTNKETWKPSSKDTLIGYYQWQHKQAPLRGLSVNRGPQSTLAQSSFAWMYNGRWQRVWTNRLFTELNVGEWGYDFPEVPSVDYKQFPPRTDLGTGADTGAGFTQGGTAGPFVEHPAKPQAFGTVTYYLPTKRAGSHDIKAGFEWLNEMWTDTSNGESGPLLYLDYKGQPDEIRVTDLGDPAQLGRTWTAPIDGDHKAALYAQDRWAVNSHVTVTAGLRYDRQQPYYTSSKRAPVLSDVFPTTTTPGAVLFTRNNVAPRLGVSWDPSGEGRTAVKAFYGRYYDNFSDSLAAVDPGGANTKTYTFLNTAGDGLYHGPQDLGTLVSSTGGSSTTYNPDMPTPYADEIDLSVQRQLWGESSVRLAYVRKMERNNYSTFNLLRVGQLTVPVTVPVTLQSIDQGVEGVQDFTVFDVPNSLRGQVQNIIDTTPGDSGDPGGAANFDTFELAFNKRFTEGLFLDSSFDWTLLQQLQHANSSYENIYPTVPAFQRTSQWELHLSSRYEFPYAIGLGANLDVQSGPTYARTISVNLPNSGTQRFYMAAFSGNELDTVPYLSLRLDKAIVFGTHRLTGMLDVFNVLNANPVTGLNSLNGKLYNQITGVLAPRTLELGARFEF